MNYLIYGINRTMPRVALALLLAAIVVLLPGLLWLGFR